MHYTYICDGEKIRKILKKKMREILFLFWLFTNLPTATQAQQYSAGYKSFNDSVFAPGDIMLAPEIVFSMNNGPYVLPESFDSVKVIADFLIAHPDICIEIGVHTDIRGNEIYNDSLSHRRARAVKDVLVRLYEIDPARIETKGYGEQQLLIPEEETNAAPTKEMQEAMHRINRRVEVKIIHI